MKKILILLLLALPCYAGTTNVGSIEGSVVHSIQSPWIIVDETTSAGTEPTALSDSNERTYKQVVDLIDAASSGDDEISIFRIPSKWNSIRLRSINVTLDSGSSINQIYFGTLGNDTDCALSYAGQLAWTSGDQDSIYYQIGLTSGGTVVPKTGDIARGNSSNETAVIVSVTSPSEGSWADANAVAVVTYKSASGVFTASETVTIIRNTAVQTTDGYTHAATDLVQFEYADVLAVTGKAWGSSWTVTSPNDDTNAEAEIDVKGADIMVVVTSTCTADSKLLAKGY